MPSVTLVLRGGPVDVTLGGLGYPWAAQVIDLGDPAPWLAAWDSLYLEFSGQRSVSSDVLETAFAQFYIRSLFTCSDGLGVTISGNPDQRALNSETGTDVCTPDGLVVNAAGGIGIGSAAGYIRHTRPLDDCFGFDVTHVGNFSPKPKNTATIDVHDSPPGSLVLCPSGGSSPYIFGIASGNLPGGMALNPSTGAITGSPDGSRPGSKDIGFYVLDADHSYATVTCSFLQACFSTDPITNLFY